MAKPEISTADRLRSRERAGGELACLFQQPDLENHWVPMRNRALPSVMAFVAQATGFRNAEWGIRNAEWGIRNGGWQMPDGKWQMAESECQMANDEWPMADER